ncbi:excisionase family DNA-binding protein [Cylindrospermopsis raciborskii CHAB3438]|uniref:helix-turn-helix domain-containing protein n=1 Tax=Cylindrospermopsis raciborskii TaxID=77022 RepID=UPI001F102B43|nr:helix-turn-helix domain-containing protein [Cylindrospermopsis raciborskii]MCH4903885.1 excisionase family DNA-binding protein [Cylindrospermopsis raciborskii CHAB3438]
MLSTVLDHQPITAREEDRPALIELEDLLGQLDPESPTFQIVSTSGAAIDIPTPVFNLMQRMVHELLQGNSVTIVPIHKELTTQEAADILNVSRQYLVELLDAQTIPHTKVGTHRRIRFGNLMHYKTERDAKRQAGLSRMTKKSQQLGLYTEAANTLQDPQGT